MGMVERVGRYRLPYTIEVSYPAQEGKPDNRAYVELRHMKDKELEKKVNLAIKEVIRQITDSPESVIIQQTGGNGIR